MGRLISHPRRVQVGWGLILICAPFLLGCGNTATVSGTVKYKDKLLKGGTVKFQTPDKKFARFAPIQDDGTYTISQVPVGLIQVAVVTSDLKRGTPAQGTGQGFKDASKNTDAKGKLSGGPGEEAKNVKDFSKSYYARGSDADKYTEINPKYEDFDKSGLDFTVTKGKMDHPIDLP